MSEVDIVLCGPRDDSPYIHNSAGSALLELLRTLGDKEFIVFPDFDQKYTFRDVLQHSVWFVNLYKDFGVCREDVITMFTHTSPCYLPALVGALFMGSPFSPMNPDFTLAEKEHMLKIIQPKLIMGDSKIIEELKMIEDKFTWSPHLLVMDRMDKASEEQCDHMKVEDDESWIDSPALVLCSSGTTGLPKAVVNSHVVMLLSIKKAKLQADQMEMVSGEMQQPTFLLSSPPFWASGLIPIMNIASKQRTIWLRQADVQQMLDCVQKYKVMGMFMSPIIAMAMAGHPKYKDYDISSLKMAYIGGSAMNEQVERMLQERLGFHVFQGYGLTEAMLLTGNKPNGTYKPGSVGQPETNITIKIVDVETGKSLGPNKEGELLVKSPALMLGYMNNPEATAAAIDPAGWFHTGDIAYYDDDGFIFIVDRIKELIKFRGHHVPPMEVESVLMTHPGLKQAVVVGIENPVDMEHARAYVVRQEGQAVSEEELTKLVEDKLSDRHRLRGGVRFVDAIPLTPSGKPLRRLLRNMK